MESHKILRFLWIWLTPAGPSDPLGNLKMRPPARLLPASLHELDFDAARDDARRRALVEQTLDGLAPACRVVERQLVDPHPDEAIRRLRVHVARELHGVLKRVGAVVERVADARVQALRD